MKLLALDTSTDACSVALACGERRAERYAVMPRQHSRLLIPMIGEVLAETGATLGQLDAIVLGNGPGSFIGVRIAASVAQGLAFGSGLGIVPVSSLAAVAAETFASSAAERVVVAQDAHREEVYLAFYERGEHGLPVALEEAVLHPVAMIDALRRPAGAGPSAWQAAGAGWQRYPDLYRLNEQGLAGIAEVTLPRAGFLLETGERSRRAGEVVAPGKLVPSYVRMQVAREPAVTRAQ